MPEPAQLGGLLGPVLAELDQGDALDRWIDRVRSLRGCTNPVHLAGEKIRVDSGTGEVLGSYSTAAEPRGELLVRCKNRRAAVCAACSEEYRADTYQLIKAGVAGGSKGVPASVGVHPRVFITLTAPSFGAVHRGPGKDGKTRICHPRRSGPSCFAHHRAEDPLIGQPLDPGSYDYVGHVLWQAHAGELWRRFTIHLRHHLASAAGLTRAEFAQRVRVSYAKVAEFQARGVIHFHAVIRLDGASREPRSWPLPPVWASLDMLTSAADSAIRATSLEVSAGGESYRLAWGNQYDIRPIGDFGPDHGALSDTAVAGYIAKYATKAAEEAGGLDRRLTDLAHLDADQVRPHVARLIETCWRLGNRHVHPHLEHLNLRKWAHMLGFRGHFATKSRRYSTTLGALRQARADYSAGYPWDAETWTPTRPDDSADTTLVLSDWRYLGQGLTPGELALVAVITGRSPSEGAAS
ncbi:replication initiator protein RepSA [Marinactinospora endophytica]